MLGEGMLYDLFEILKWYEKKVCMIMFCGKHDWIWFSYEFHGV